jgi:hypothetical protein
MSATAPVYVAHPMSGYGSRYTTACLDVLAGLLPGARLLDPATIFASDSEWRQTWPRLLRTLEGFVIFGDTDGTVGGCIRELSDAIAHGVPIAGFHLGRGLRDISGFDIIDAGSRSARRTALLRLGRGVEAAAWGKPPRGSDEGAKTSFDCESAAHNS